jgi:hypothetical protein
MGDSTMLDERGKFHRFKIRQMIELSLGRESYLQAEGVNVSERGLLCESNEHIEPYTRLYLMISLPVNDCENQEITCEGIVLRSVENGDKFSIAVNFTDLREEDREKLRGYTKLTLAFENSVRGGNG